MKHRRARAAAILVLAGSLFGSVLARGASNASPPQESAACVACHGAHGEGAANGVPRLAGQDADYMSHALSMFRDGTRASALMQPIARTLDDAQMRALAGYFSQQAPPLAQAAAVSPQLALAGRQLAESGGPDVPACFSCHGAQGQGEGARFPRIASQPAQFTVDRLHEFQERARAKPPAAGSMTAVSATMTEEQIHEAAAYLSQLAP
jgi:cytochrome c553